MSFGQMLLNDIKKELIMCGIVGLFLKEDSLKPELGNMLSQMLVTMSDRGPDSAGIAVYNDEKTGESKLTIQSIQPEKDFPELVGYIKSELNVSVSLKQNHNHAVLYSCKNQVNNIRELLQKHKKEIGVVSIGEQIEIYKEVGLPKFVAETFNLKSMTGSHGIGHTRMATESAVSTLGAHPFSTGPDQCLVHNGSLSNHSSLRRKLKREGIYFETENDTEVGAAYLSWCMQQGFSLKEALQKGLSDLDGFYTFVVGTKNGFGVLRDSIACKPAIMAENSKYVAFGSEYRALAVLPNIDQAEVWEPEPATVYFWNKKT